MVRRKSSKVPKNSPQMVHKKSSKVQGRFFNVWEHQVLRSSKSPQKVHKVFKKSRKCTKGTQGHQTSGSQQKFLKVVLKWSADPSPQKFLKTVLKWSTRSHQKFKEGSSMFWEHQALRSSKSPQKVHKVLKKSRKCTKGTQGPQTSGSQLILKVSSNSSKGHQIPRSHQKSTKGIQGDLNSSKRYQRPQNAVVVKSSSNGHQMVLRKSSKVPINSPQMFHKKSSKVPERFFNVLISLMSTGL